MKQVALSALVAALAVNMPEAWHWLTPYGVWAADKIAQGGLQCALAVILVTVLRKEYWPACAVLLVFGMARAVCTAVWPDASDAGASIFDTQTGIPGTLIIAALAAFAAERLARDDDFTPH